MEALIDQVSQWIKHEREKQASKKPKSGNLGKIEAADDATDEREFGLGGAIPGATTESFDLDKLESIIKQNLSLERRSRYSRNTSPAESRKGSFFRSKQKSTSMSSETDNFENDILVPSSDAVLDNSKTLSYTGGASEDSDSDSDDLRRTASYRSRDEWAKFKFEIVRLTHTLRLKRWRRVPLNMSNSIHVQRLSGALTNAVYVVSPPHHLPTDRSHSSGSISTPQKPPPKLLLRIYGPQVEHLIDRDAELAILHRLARKRIGPRMLGTFANGRFEEYFYAETLTPADIRNPDTSRQIAKRMRELHDGIELLNQERDDGPFVWRNWDKWVPRVEKVVSWLDCQVKKLPAGAKPGGPEAWKRRGFICGVPWKQFRHMVEKYRKWLYEQYGSTRNVKEQLVFAHNDTQYGNILRLMPTGESPLLLPQNTHKQLVVIDFEYANANLQGLEFANHFTEWCYNYHDERKPYAFHPNRYPTPEEQDRFVRAYVRHRPEYNVSTPRMVPSTPPISTSDSSDSLSRQPTSSITSFILDARTPSTAVKNYSNEEAARKTAEDQEVTRLLHETRLWRLANTAQWVTWGIVQAKVPGMPDFSFTAGAEPGSADEEASREDLGERADEYRDLVAQHQQPPEEVNESDEVVEDEFDYLGYAQHRALFFWADALQLGLVHAKELPEELKEKLKTVPY
jgi:choline kinase